VAISTNKNGDIVFLINNLEIIEVFKDKDGKEGANIRDFII